jgi:hypothetical protein
VGRGARVTFPKDVLCKTTAFTKSIRETARLEPEEVNKEDATVNEQLPYGAATENTGHTLEAEPTESDTVAPVGET